MACNNNMCNSITDCIQIWSYTCLVLLLHDIIPFLCLNAVYLDSMIFSITIPTYIVSSILSEYLTTPRDGYMS